MRKLLLACELALRDWTHERLLSTCAVLTLASVLTPLLVLSGVRYGVMSALQDKLLQDPAILTITPVGSGGYTQEWLRSVLSSPDVRFGILRTRDIAATMQLVHETPKGTRLVRVSMEPTATGDPLLARAGIHWSADGKILDQTSASPNLPSNQKTSSPLASVDTIVLSASAARKLEVRVNQLISGQLGRKRIDGVLESVSLPLRVVAVLPPASEDKDVAFVPLPLLEDAEDYRDSIAVPRRGFSGDSRAAATSGENRRYAGFRLYATQLDAVARIQSRLTASGIEVMTKAREIAVVGGLDASLTLIFSLIVLAAGAGFAASTAGSVLAAVRRKDKQLGMLRLIGFSGASIMAYPVTQAVCTGFLGSLVAGSAYLGIAYAIDSLFSEQLGAVVCRLTLFQFLAALGIVLALSVLASIQASVRAAHIEPSDVLREL